MHKTKDSHFRERGSKLQKRERLFSKHFIKKKKRKKTKDGDNLEHVWAAMERELGFFYQDAKTEKLKSPAASCPFIPFYKQKH
jgi:nuclear transport factor 2 (NTF2) superfamily protein